MDPVAGQFINGVDSWSPEFGYILNLKSSEWEDLIDDLDSRNQCGKSIKKIPKSIRKKKIICFVSVKAGSLTHVARAEVRYPSESGRDRLDLWNVLALPSPISIVKIRRRLPSKSKVKLNKSLNGGHISSSALRDFMEVIRGLDQDAVDLIDNILVWKGASEAVVNEVAQEVWALQCDAAKTALNMAGLSKMDLGVDPVLDFKSVGKKSIFDTDSDTVIVEDVAILRDLDHVDPDWVQKDVLRYPCRIYTNGVSKLTLILCNKLELEKQLGVDLIYVNEEIESVVCVQYKMFRTESGGERYRPDAQLVTELERMKNVNMGLSNQVPGVDFQSYRMLYDPFFLKFCSKHVPGEEKSILPGYYISLEAWDRIYADPKSKGRQGGIVISPETFRGRHLTSTTFIDLVHRGLIGTEGLKSQHLMEYIKEVMDGGKSAFVAIKSPCPVGHGEIDKVDDIDKVSDLDDDLDS